jgi:hypothetical protein
MPCHCKESSFILKKKQFYALMEFSFSTKISKYLQLGTFLISPPLSTFKEKTMVTVIRIDGISPLNTAPTNPASPGGYGRQAQRNLSAYLGSSTFIDNSGQHNPHHYDWTFSPTGPEVENLTTSDDYSANLFAAAEEYVATYDRNGSGGLSRQEYADSRVTLLKNSRDSLLNDSNLSNALKLCILGVTNLYLIFKKIVHPDVGNFFSIFDKPQSRDEITPVDLAALYMFQDNAPNFLQQGITQSINDLEQRSKALLALERYLPSKLDGTITALEGACSQTEGAAKHPDITAGIIRALKNAKLNTQYATWTTKKNLNSLYYDGELNL